MKKILSIIALVLLFACNNTGDEEKSELKFAAILPSGDQKYITADGDTVVLKKVTKVISYDSSWFELLPKKQDTIVVPPGNIMPTANAGPDKVITLPTNRVVLVGDGGDEDGAFTVSWTKVSGSGTVTVSNVLVNAVVENLTVGTTVIRLTVTGDKGEKVSDDMAITVLPVTPPPPPVQTHQLSFTQIPFSAADLNRPGAGAEQWHDRNDVNLGYTPQDVYWRFVATRIATATRGVYNWTFFDNLFEQAKAKGQKVSFGIMTVYPDGDPNVGLISIPAGGYASYPLWLHNSMMNKSVKAWRTGNTWTPNYNDTTYTNWLLELHKAINDHIYAKGYDKMINAIDIRGYGAWGEWHSGYTPNNVVTDYPAGTFPTTAALKRIVDAHIQAFPNFQLQCMIAGFDANWLGNTKNPPEIAHYLLTSRNAYGLIGWRRDQWGALDDYLKGYLENNTRSFNGLVFKDSIMVRYKSAPITGEPPAWNPNEYGDLERQIRLYGATSFGNGNYGGLGGQSVARVIAASKAAGYRLTITAGTIQTGSNTTVSLTWNNSGICPTYENWNVVFDVTDNSGAVKSFTSKFKPRLFLPGSTTISDVLAVTNIKQITVKVVDAGGYRSPMPLFIQGRNSNGSYTLKTF